MPKCMIGPAAPGQICPDCEGEGFQYRGERQEYRLEEWVMVSIWATCDICGGSGRVTKRALKQLLTMDND